MLKVLCALLVLAGVGGGGYLLISKHLEEAHVVNLIEAGKKHARAAARSYEIWDVCHGTAGMVTTSLQEVLQLHAGYGMPLIILQEIQAAYEMEARMFEPSCHEYTKQLAWNAQDMLDAREVFSPGSTR